MIADSRALIVGEDRAGVERLVPVLRQARCEVRRAAAAVDGMQLIGCNRFDLIVVVLPLAGARPLLAAVRAEGSPSLHAGLLVIDTDLSGKSIDPALIELANRMLPSDAPQEELQRAVTMLLGVAPRVPVHGRARMRLHPQERERLLAITNVSESGMLVRGEALPVGSLCGFELQLPDQPGPIRGRARVVRRQEQELGVTFLAFGGEGGQLLARLVEREIAALDAPRPSTLRAGATPADVAAPTVRTAASGGDEGVAQAEAELADLMPLLDDALRAGLSRRLGVADWYVTGAALGLESLRAFSAILEVVYRGDTQTLESSRRLGDLIVVRQKLGEFAKPQQGVQARMEILLAIRPALERLLHELAEGGGGRQTGDDRQRDAIAQLCLDVNRLVRSRGSLEGLRRELAELERPRYVVVRRLLRRRAELLSRQYRCYGALLGLDRAEQLMGRRGRQIVAREVEREIRRLDEWLAAIHQQVYAGKRGELATGNLAHDLAERRLYAVVSETLAAGCEYLVRTYSAYRHALELAGADPALLDHVAGLAASLAVRPRHAG